VREKREREGLTDRELQWPELTKPGAQHRGVKTAGGKGDLTTKITGRCEAASETDLE